MTLLILDMLNTFHFPKSAAILPKGHARREKTCHTINIVKETLNEQR